MAKHASNPDHVGNLTAYQIDALKRLRPESAPDTGIVANVGKHGVSYARSSR